MIDLKDFPPYLDLPKRSPPKPQTNADRIRSMTDEKLAEYINAIFYGFHENPGFCDVCKRDSVQNCKECWIEWLKQECADG